MNRNVERQINNGGSQEARRPRLSVRDLRTQFVSKDGIVPAVDGVSFDVYPGEILGIVGESGSGKSVMCLSIARLVPAPGGRIVSGEVYLDDTNLLGLSEREMREIRGRRIGFITQDPLASLDPLFKIGSQIGEALLAHKRAGQGDVRQRVVDLLRRVRIRVPERAYSLYPHEMSGGMRQRSVTALAVGCEPEVLIADEPTTALDATVQIQVLEVLKRLQEEQDLSIIFVTHDISAIARICSRVAVMYAGRIVEESDIVELFERPLHPYTRGLMASVASVSHKPGRMVSIEGQPPDLKNLPPGCPFAPRCEYRRDECELTYPPMRTYDDRHRVACWAADELLHEAPIGTV